MTQPTKIWKKCIAKRTLTDYTIDPPSIKEWIESETTYDEKEDVMVCREYNQDGKLKIENILYDDITHFSKYDEKGEKISEEVVEQIKSDRGDFIMNSIDSDDNLKAEKLEYDERGRCIKKMFLENGKVDSWLEFEYDNRDRVIKTREYENDKLNVYEEDIYVSDEESITLRYDSIGRLTLRSDYKKLSDRNTFINLYYTDEGKLIKKIEEDLDINNNVIAQRIYGANNTLKIEKIFGPDDEFGFRIFLIERKYQGSKLITEVVTDYDYIY